MAEDESSQYAKGEPPGPEQQGVGDFETVVPNPKLKLMDQVREVMRLKHDAIRTETCYGDWIRRFVKFHRMKSRADLSPGTAKVEERRPLRDEKPLGLPLKDALGTERAAFEREPLLIAATVRFGQET